MAVGGVKEALGGATLSQFIAGRSRKGLMAGSWVIRE